MTLRGARLVDVPSTTAPVPTITPVIPMQSLPLIATVDPTSAHRRDAGPVALTSPIPLRSPGRALTPPGKPATGTIGSHASPTDVHIRATPMSSGLNTPVTPSTPGVESAVPATVLRAHPAGPAAQRRVALAAPALLDADAFAFLDAAPSSESRPAHFLASSDARDQGARLHATQSAQAQGAANVTTGAAPPVQVLASPLHVLKSAVTRPVRSAVSACVSLCPRSCSVMRLHRVVL